MTPSLTSFCAGFLAFGLDVLVMILAVRMVLQRPRTAEGSRGLRTLALGAMALGKIFLLIGASYAAIAYLGLPAMEFVGGATFSVVSVVAGAAAFTR